MSTAPTGAQTAQVSASSGAMAATSGAISTAATGANASPTASAAQSTTTAGPNAQFPLAEGTPSTFSTVQQGNNIFPTGTEGLTGSSPHMFLQTDDQQQQQQVSAAASTQQQGQRQRTKPVYTQATQQGSQLQSAHLAGAGGSNVQDQFLRRQQQTFPVAQNQENTSQPMQQIQARSYAATETRVGRAGNFVQNQSQQSQHVDASGTAASVAGAAQEAFNAAAQIGSTTVPGGPQFGFDEGVRRRQVANAGASQHPAVVLGFSGEYIGQQDGAQLAQENANFPARFEGDPTLVGPTVVYEDAKRMVGALPEATLQNAVMDPNLQLRATAAGKTGAAARATAAAMPYGGETVDKCVECEVCGLLFGDAGSLKRHAARAHRPATGKGPVYCSQCSASLKNEQNLRRHIAVCHSGNQENRCDMCSASFSSRGSLRIHQQSVHSMPGQNKGAAGRNGARGVAGRPGGPANRMGGRPRGAGVQKSNKSEKSYLCDMCTDTFKWKGNLKRHRELRHLQLRPFECHVCHANFGTKSNMRVHLITHNNAPVPK